MEKLKVYYGKNGGFDNVDVAVFSTDTCHSYGYIFQINKDFKIDSSMKHIYGYYLDLTDKKILNLKQFKVEIS